MYLHIFFYIFNGTISDCENATRGHGQSNEYFSNVNVNINENLFTHQSLIFILTIIDNISQTLR